MLCSDSPGAPGSPQVGEVTCNSIAIHWMEPVSTGGTEVTGYIIERKKKDVKSDFFISS